MAPSASLRAPPPEPAAAPFDLPGPGAERPSRPRPSGSRKALRLGGPLAGAPRRRVAGADRSRSDGRGRRGRDVGAEGRPAGLRERPSGVGGERIVRATARAGAPPGGRGSPPRGAAPTRPGPGRHGRIRGRGPGRPARRAPGGTRDRPPRGGCGRRRADPRGARSEAARGPAGPSPPRGGAARRGAAGRRLPFRRRIRVAPPGRGPALRSPAHGPDGGRPGARRREGGARRGGGARGGAGGGSPLPGRVAARR